MKILDVSVTCPECGRRVTAKCFDIFIQNEEGPAHPQAKGGCPHPDCYGRITVQDTRAAARREDA